jgi:hypothetical protein
MRLWRSVTLGMLLAGLAKAAIGQERCERLCPGASAQEFATCNTLLDLRGSKVSDEELRELVSRQTYGVSWPEVESVKKKRRDAEEQAERDAAARIAGSQCGRLFSDAFQRDVCLWDTSITFRERTDQEVRESVLRQLLQNFAASGTRISTLRNILYEALKPKERASFEINMGLVHSQSARASCAVLGWK